MKKLLTTLLITFCTVFLATASASAMSFYSSGTVNPNSGDSWNEGTLTGTASYQFYIEEPGFSVNYVEIEFEDDIFDVSKIDTGDFSVLSPAGWDTTLHNTSDGKKWSLSYGGTVATSLNDPIVIQFDYTLLSADRYMEASGVDGSGSWQWDEGQVWGQAYLLSYKINVDGYGLLGLDTSGGSTSAVPIPSTLLLLSSGFIGLLGTKIRKNYKNLIG